MAIPAFIKKKIEGKDSKSGSASPSESASPASGSGSGSKSSSKSASKGNPLMKWAKAKGGKGKR